MPNTPSTNAIKAWATEDRPREKMLLKGKAALTDAELLAILISSGTVGESAVALAQRILAASAFSLHELSKLSVNDLQKFKGIGQAKAITIAAALELGCRRQLADLQTRPKITCSRDAFEIIAAMLIDLPHEEFWCLALNKKNEVLARQKISAGGTSGTVVDLKMLFKNLLEIPRVSGFIAVHNHPSGNLQPSPSDIELTKKIHQSGKLLDLPLLDHLIVSERGYYSFADSGML